MPRVKVIKIIEKEDLQFDYSKYDFKDNVKYVYETPEGISEEIIREISEIKGEPEWMLNFRLKAYRIFKKLPMPKWGPSLDRIDFDKIRYYLRPTEKSEKTWEDVPEEIKETFDKLGIPEAERKFLAGVGAQYDSELVYHSLAKELEQQGVIFLGTDQALQEYPEIFKKYFATVVPPADNKFAALNSAVWSGGSFVYVPKNTKVDFPLQAYFRINAQRAGQFERTLIVIEEGSDAHYIEGCTAPIYSTNSLHAAVVEVIAKKNAHLRYTTIQNWSTNVYNLVTKRAHAYEGAFVEWIDGNIGATVTMKYPAIYLLGENAKAEVISIAYAGDGQQQDTGAKAVHMAPNTSSRIINKSVSNNGGITTYRGLVHVAPGCVGAKVNVQCDALLLDNISKTDTYPYIEVQEDDVTITHEATVGKISEDILFYAMTRGIPEAEALNMVVMGFLEPFTKELPLEYAVELNKLIKLEMEGSVG